MKTIRLAIDDELENKNITRYELSKLTAIHYNTIDKYYKNKISRYDSFILLKICIALNCNISDIIKIEEI